MRYGLGILFAVFLLIVGGVVFVSNNRSDTGVTAQKAARYTKMSDYADKDTSSISWTVQGRLVGEDQRHSIRVIVTRSTRSVQILNGYGDQVVAQKDYQNTPEAYQAFTRALDNAAFGQERDVPQPDERGICPLGYRYIYRMTDNAKEVMRTWSDTCSAKDGSFGGGTANAPLVQQLFKSQITDYLKFTQNTLL